MADADETAGVSTGKRSNWPLMLGLALALAGAGGGFVAAYFGLLPWGESPGADGAHAAALSGVTPAALDDVDFVAIEPLVVSLSAGSGMHLRFRAQLEVRRTHKTEVEHLLPRVVDVLNGYLRAVDIADLRNNAALVRLRAQMLRRVQMVTGADRVTDLLIMEFVVN